MTMTGYISVLLWNKQRSWEESCQERTAAQ